MLTDDRLGAMLRQSFDEATQDLYPADGLAGRIRRRHVASTRRRVALRAAVPIVAAASLGAALTLPGAEHPASGRASGAAPATRHLSLPPASRPPASLVGYRVAAPARFAPPGCLDIQQVRASGKDDWLMVIRPACVVGLVQTLDSLPPQAKPISLGTMPGLYGYSDAAAGTRTVLAPAAPATKQQGDPQWFSLTVTAAVTDAQLARFFVPDDN